MKIIRQQLTMNKSRLSIILCLLMMTIGATAKLLPGPIGRTYDTGPEIPTAPRHSYIWGLPILPGDTFCRAILSL